MDDLNYFDFVAGIRTVPEHKLLWWANHFGPQSLLPRQLCDELSSGLPGETTYTLSLIEPRLDRADIEVESRGPFGQMWQIGRSFHFKDRTLNMDIACVWPQHRNQGYGRLIALNAYRLANDLEFDRLTLTAIDAGAYFWARNGFLPTEEAWSSDNCKGRIFRHLHKIRKRLTPESFHQAHRYVSSPSTQAIWRLADMQDDVASEAGEPVRKLGETLIKGARASWRGSLELHGDDLSRIQIRRFRHYHGLGEDE